MYRRHHGFLFAMLLMVITRPNTTVEAWLSIPNVPLSMTPTKAVSSSMRPFQLLQQGIQSNQLFKHKHFHFSSTSTLWKSATNDAEYQEEEKAEDRSDEIVTRVVDTLVEQVSFRIRRVSWLSWWSQVILTNIAAVTLLFTRNVLALQTAGVFVNRNLLPNYFLAGSSITLSYWSIFWTWAIRRLSRRFLRKPTTRIQAANLLRKNFRIGIILNLLGVAFALVGAEQIVGGLAVKVLTTATSTPAVYQGAQSVSLLQPLDILVVQANTNTLFSHYCSLVAYLWLGRFINRLDPPSKDD